MRRTLLLLALCTACAQQDPALLVTVSGGFRVPADADKLSIDVLDSALVIKHRDWCVTTSADCPDALPPMQTLSGSIVLVQSGAAHPHVKINATLYKGQSPVGLGTSLADFQSGRTVEVSIQLTSP